MRITTLVFSLCVGLAGVALGQGNGVTASAGDPAAYPVSLYKSATGYTQNLYNGRQYYVYDARNDEHQFFEENQWRKGVLRYDGQVFDSISMMYDIVRDQLVIKHIYGDNLLLQSEKVEYFKLADHIFRRMESGKEVNASMRSGFYDVLYDGKTRAVVRRTKSRQEKIAEKRVIALFPAKNFCYILKDGEYHFVHSKRSVFELFPNRKRDIRRVLREKHLHFRTNRETAIVAIASAYDKTATP